MKQPHLLFLYIFLDIRFGLKVRALYADFILGRLEAAEHDMRPVVLFTCVDSSFTLKLK